AERSWTNGNAGQFGAGNPLLTLPPGDYVLAVRTTVDRTGSFSFRLADMANVTELTLGSPVSGTLSPGSEAETRTFGVAAGDRLDFDAQHWGSGNIYWRLIGPYGEVYFGQGFPQDQDTLTLTENGRYLLMIDGHPADQGSNPTFRFAVYPN